MCPSRTRIGERLSSASGDVGIQIRLGLLELIQEPILDRRDLVGVVGVQAIEAIRPQVTDFDGHVLAEWALQPGRELPAERFAQIRIEHTHVIGRVAGTDSLATPDSMLT